jgi:hypothetical protein
MKKTKNLFRMWIAGVSVAGFMFGWGTFAHANNQGTAGLSQSQASTTVSATQAADTSTTSRASTSASLQTFQTVQQPQFSTSPRLRTGGS